MTVGELIRRLELFPPEFPVFFQLDPVDLAVRSPRDIRITVVDPAALVTLADKAEVVPDGFEDCVVLYPHEIDDGPWEESDA